VFSQHFGDTMVSIFKGISSKGDILEDVVDSSTRRSLRTYQLLFYIIKDTLGLP
jgi:hypothetical protein